MTDALNSTVPAGWYPDPWGAPEQRWWNGSGWTEAFMPAPPSEEPVRATAHPHRATPAEPETTTEPAFPSRRALRELGVATGTVPIVTPESFDHPAPAMTATPLPPLTQAPEFTPEPVSALPPPTWTDAEQPVAPTPSLAQEHIPATTAEPAPAQPAATAPVTPLTTPAAEGWPSVASAPVPVSPEADDWAASLSKWEDVDTSTAPPEASPIFGDAPPISYSQRSVRYKPLHGRTSAVWFIVFMPVLQAAAVAGSVLLFPAVLTLFATIPPALPTALPTEANLVAIRDWLLFAAAPLAFAFFVFTLVMGFQDRARLRLLGHDRTASPWWILLHPFVYLIVRSVRVRQSTGRKGSGPLTTYICFYIAPGIALTIATVVINALDGAIPT